MSAAPETVERPCTEAGCDFVARGPKSGGGNAAFILGAHRRRVHGVAGTTAKKKKGSPSELEHAERPVLGVVRDVASEFTGKGPPSSDELKRGLGRGIGYVSIAVAAYAVETDPTIPDGPEGEAQRDALIDDLSLTTKAGEDVMAPLGRALAPTKLNQRFGRQAVENVDVISSVAELVTLGLRWRRYFRQRSFRTEAMRPIDVVSPDPVVVAPSPAPPVHGASRPPSTTGPWVAPPGGGGGGGAVPPPPPAANGNGGVVVTPEMVESMRAKRGT